MMPRRWPESPGAVGAGPLALIDAYRHTAYLAWDDVGRGVAYVDRLSPSMDSLLSRNGVDSGAFVTAWNPGSQPRPGDVNRRANAKLARVVAALGARVLPHFGQPAGSDWPGEEGFLILDCDRARALGLARDFGQTAVVHVTVGGKAKLLFA